MELWSTVHTQYQSIETQLEQNTIENLIYYYKDY